VLQQPLTGALLLAHNQGSHEHPPSWPTQLATPLNDVESVPYPLLDWRSTEARHARWNKIRRQLSRASSLAELSVTSESSFDRSTVVSQENVPGGHKGHSVGRSGRKQLAGLIAAVWLQRFDKFGSPVPSAKASWQGAEALVELCDALEEVEQIAGIWSLLGHGVDESGDARSEALGVKGTFLDRVHSNTSILSREGSLVECSKVSSMPALGAALRRHAHCVEVLVHEAPMLRNLAAAAESSHAWPAATHSHAAWQRVFTAAAAAWTLVVDTCSCSTAEDGLQPNNLAVTSQAGQNTGQTAVCVMDHMHAHDARAVEFVWLSFGLWCTAVLLQLAVVEPRPDLWGRYVAALNPLQGILRTVRGLSRPGNIGESTTTCTQRGHDRHTGAFLQGASHSQDNGWHERRLPAQLGQGAERASCAPRVLEDVLCLVLEVERHIKACGSRREARGPAVAFSKGKENILPLVKRYKAFLLGVSETHVSHPPAGGASGKTTGLRDSGGIGSSRVQTSWRDSQQSACTLDRVSGLCDTGSTGGPKVHASWRESQQSPSASERGAAPCTLQNSGAEKQSWNQRSAVGGHWSAASSVDDVGHSSWRVHGRGGGQSTRGDSRRIDRRLGPGANRLVHSPEYSRADQGTWR
jgi:hypothetical protein